MRLQLIIQAAGDSARSRLTSKQSWIADYIIPGSMIQAGSSVWRKAWSGPTAWQFGVWRSIEHPSLLSHLMHGRIIVILRFLQRPCHLAVGSVGSKGSKGPRFFILALPYLPCPFHFPTCTLTEKWRRRQPRHVMFATSPAAPS